MSKAENSIDKKTKSVSAEKSQLAKMKNASEELILMSENTENEMKEYYDMLVDGDSVVSEEDVQNRIESLRTVSSNLTKASLVSISLEDELRARWHDVRKSKSRRIVSAAPSNTMIDYKEEKTAHFAQGRNFYKMAIVFTIGSVIGVIVEMLWCLITNGYLESRRGQVWGPINMLYGAGAVALTLALYEFRNHSRWMSFFGGMLIGSVVEYVCSFFQEMFFGCRSWDYSDMPFNINGRICLLYSIFWGFLGVLWIKNLYPRMANFILKIPNKIGKTVTWLLVAFLIVDGAVTFVALERWSQRFEGIPASNSFWEFIDERFDDERMRRIYANMEFGEKTADDENTESEQIDKIGEAVNAE